MTKRRRTGAGVWTGEDLLIPLAGLAYTPATDTWRTTTPPPISDRTRALVIGYEEGAVVFGGCVGDRCDESNSKPVADGAWYHASTDHWHPIEAGPLTGGAHLLGVNQGSLVTIVGTDDSGVTKAAQFDPGSGEWTVLPDPPLSPRRHAAILEHRDRLVRHAGEAKLVRWCPEGASDERAVVFDGGQIDGRIVACRGLGQPVGEAQHEVVLGFGLQQPLLRTPEELRRVVVSAYPDHRIIRLFWPGTSNRRGGR